MLIEAFKKYIVLCKGPDHKVYRWNLDVVPGKKAWKVKDQIFKIGNMVKDHYIISIEEVKEVMNEDCSDEEEFWEQPISEDEFDFAVGDSGIGFAVNPSFGQAYRCDICGGIVASDICTSCMFDWDS